MCTAIAFDGPAGVGKSTVAQAIARRLGFKYIDTGAMYRAATLFALEQGLAACQQNQEKIAALVGQAPFRFVLNGQVKVYHGQRDITEAVRSLEVSRHVSQVAALPAVRQSLTELQRQMAAGANVVVEGRDIGTVVLPAAQYKFFLTASVATRARRRHRELREKGIAVDLASIEEGIAARDRLDGGRKLAPLQKATDAIEIDTSDLTVDEVIDKIMGFLTVL